MATAGVRDPTFPICLPLRGPFAGVRGWLLVGPRRDGFFYGRDELNALGSILPALRQTLFAAREQEKDRAREVRAKRTVSQAINQLSKRLDALESTTP